MSDREAAEVDRIVADAELMRAKARLLNAQADEVLHTVPPGPAAE